MLEVTEGQHRSIKTTLWMLDRLLCTLEKWSAHQEMHSDIYQEINFLSDKDCRLLSEKIVNIRKVMNTIQNDFNFDTHQQSIGLLLQSMTVLFITDHLTPLLNDNLKSYGAISPAVIEYLDPKVREIIVELEQIAYLGAKAGSTEPS